MIDWESIEDILVNHQKTVSLKVRGTSMYPALMTDDEITLEPMSSLLDKDMVLVKCGEKYLVHRFDVSTGLSKGDNCESFDPVADEFIGKVAKVKKTPRSVLKRIFQMLSRAFSSS